MISVDCETSGTDFYHGAKPYFVTTCDEDGNQHFWEWDVCPLTRKPIIPEFDQADIGGVLFLGERDEGLVGQNVKFDVAALRSANLGPAEWPWERTHDTLLAAHLLASNRPKDLTSLVLTYLGEDLEPYEKALEKVVQAARRATRKEFPTWRIARKDDPSMPSAKEKTWKFDGWLPRALLKAGYEPEEPEHDWATVLRDYANADSAYTLAVWQVLEREMDRRGLRTLYEERRKLPRIVAGMERRGLTLSRKRLEESYVKYKAERDERAATCVAVAASRGYELVLPKGAVNNSLRTCVYDVLKLEPVRVGTSKTRKTNNPTLDSKHAIPYYLDTLPPHSRERLFIKALGEKRARDTALAYLDGYRRFWLPDGDGDTYVLHPNLNITGSDTLRWSSSSPNEQNISKREGFNLRYAFGPAPGREWWSLDAKNIELRIPAYEADEEEMIALFERPDDPPFYGSNHMFIFSILWPELWDEALNSAGLAGAHDYVKKGYKSTNYQWTKNGNFAVQYGAMERANGLSTADRAYHQLGAQAKVKARLRKSAALNEKYIAFAAKHGYVETLPDRTVDPTKGYPLLVTRTEEGRVLPTVPLNFHVQGTAMWWTARAMVKVQAQLDAWRETGFDGYLAMQVHDEVVLDLPFRENQGNRGRVRIIQRLMASCGDDLIPRIPTPVGVEYHPISWDEGISL